MITIFYGYLSSQYHQLLLDKYMQQFPTELQQKISRFRRWQNVQATILGRLFIKQGIKSFKIDGIDDEIVYNDYGKPYFREIPFNFNISHTDNIAICAFGDEEMGIDIEKIADIDIDLYKDHFKENEWSLIQNSKNKSWEFYNFWTKKEAVLKLIGKGLSIPPYSFEILDSNKTIVENKRLSISRVNIDDNYVCNIATYLKPEIQNIKQIFIEELL